MEKVDVTMIGAGVVGLAISHLLADQYKDIIVIEKNIAFGMETSSRNSEVIHAGLYYPPNSLKAKMCLKGKHLLYALCEKNNIKFNRMGKLLVASDKAEIDKIQATAHNAQLSGVDNLEVLTHDQIKKMEPNIAAQFAIFSPDTGIVDTHAVMKYFHDTAKDKGVEFAFNIVATAIEKCSDGYLVTVSEPHGDSFSFHSRIVINAAGLHSDQIATMVGIDVEQADYKIYFCKGQYFRITNPQRFNINHLVYPSPSKTDLGIHATPDLAGGLRLGPDAFYVNEINYDINENDKEKFFISAQRFLPNLKIEDLIPDTAGIRPKLQKPTDDFRDFIIQNETEKGFDNFINLLGIESPGFTACLAIAEEVKNSIH